MSFDILTNLNSYDSVLDNFILFSDLSTTPWELVRQNASGNSSTFSTAGGAEAVSDRWAAFRKKTSINNAGTEDVKYSYILLQVDNTSNRLIVRTASYVTASSTSNVTPLVSSVKLDSTSFPCTAGFLFSEDSCGIMIKDSLNFNKFAVVSPIDTVLTSSVDFDNCFFLAGNAQECWVLPTGEYSASDLEMSSYLISDVVNDQISRVILPPLVLHDGVLFNKFVGGAKDTHQLRLSSLNAFDTMTLGSSAYTVFNNTSDGVKFLAVKES